MSGVVACIVAISTAAILGAILREMAGGGAIGAMVKFLTGLFVTLTILSPLLRLELPDMEGFLSEHQLEGAAAAAAGENMAQDARRQRIKVETESYIEDKAAGIGASLEAEVELNEKDVPLSVELYGTVSSAARAYLEQMLWTDLNLGKEAQRWIE